MKLSEHAEAWAREQGKHVPPRDTPEWRKMYVAWVEFAFQDFSYRPKRKGKVQHAS